LKIRAKKVGTTLGVLALVVAAATVVLWFRRIGQVDIPEDRTTYVVFFLSAAALGVGAFVARVRWFGGVAAVLAIVIGSFFPFTVAISRQEVAANAIRVGDSIPVFSALDENGKVFESATFAGKPVLIKFFRGHW
jgi:hypothetical protein